MRNIVQKIGFPTKSPSIREPTALRDYYASLNISSFNFFDNAVSTVKFQTNHEWTKLGKPTDRDEWVMTAPTVNVGHRLQPLLKNIEANKGTLSGIL